MCCSQREKKRKYSQHCRGISLKEIASKLRLIEKFTEILTKMQLKSYFGRFKPFQQLCLMEFYLCTLFVITAGKYVLKQSAKNLTFFCRIHKIYIAYTQHTYTIIFDFMCQRQPTLMHCIWKYALLLLNTWIL